MADTNQQLTQARDLLEQLNKLKRQLGEQPLRLGEAQLLTMLQDLPNQIRRARKELEEIEGTASDIYARLRGVTSEFKYQTDTLKKVRGAFRQLEEAAQNLKHDEQGISDLNTSQLKKLQDKIKKNKDLLRQEADQLANSNRLGKALQRYVIQQKQLGVAEDQIQQHVANRLASTSALDSEEKALLQLYFDQRDVISEINNKVLDRIAEEKKVNRLLGVAGGVVGGISSLMGKLGMNSGIFRDAVEEAEQAMGNTARNIQAGTQSGGKLTVLMAGLGPLAKGFGRALMDPATIILKLVDGFLDVNRAAVEYQRLSGINATSMAGMNSRLATSVDFLETAAELTKQTGMSATNIFSPEDIAAMAEAKNLLGLSATQAGNLGRYSKATGISIDKYKEGIVSATNKYNGANKAAVSHGLVVQDVLSASEDIALSLGGDAGRISTAATAARSLGLELAKVDQIAGSLLQFEDSIGKELEAELLTGKNLNLEKAREFALTGNLAGLSDELKKNGATAAEFAGMNRIEQESLAAALGMSRQELAKTVLSQQDAKNLTIDQRAAAMGVTVAQMEQMNIQDKITKSLDKLAQSFAPILDGIVPIIDTLLMAITPITEGVRIISELFSGWGASIAKVFGPLGAVGKVMVGLAKMAVIFAAYQTFAAVSTGLISTGIGAIAAPIVGGVAAAAVLGAGMGLLSSMKDGEFDKDGNPILYTNKGAVELLPEDLIYSANDGSMKVGTDLIGDKFGNSPSTISQVATSNKAPTAISQVATSNQAGGDLMSVLITKIDKLIEIVKEGGDVYLDSNKIGRTQTLSSLKSR